MEGAFFWCSSCFSSCLSLGLALGQVSQPFSFDFLSFHSPVSSEDEENGVAPHHEKEDAAHQSDDEDGVHQPPPVTGIL